MKRGVTRAASSIQRHWVGDRALGTHRMLFASVPAFEQMAAGMKAFYVSTLKINISH